jgi:hypothetical protein
MGLQAYVCVNMEVGFMFIPGIPCLFHIAVEHTDPV